MARIDITEVRALKAVERLSSITRIANLDFWPYEKPVEHRPREGVPITLIGIVACCE